MASIIGLKSKATNKYDLYIYDDILSGKINSYFVEIITGTLHDIDTVIAEYRFPDESRLIYYLEDYQKMKLEIID